MASIDGSDGSNFMALASQTNFSRVAEEMFALTRHKIGLRVLGNGDWA